MALAFITSSSSLSICGIRTYIDVSGLAGCIWIFSTRPVLVTSALLRSVVLGYFSDPPEPLGDPFSKNYLGLTLLPRDWLEEQRYPITPHYTAVLRYRHLVHIFPFQRVVGLSKGCTGRPS